MAAYVTLIALVLGLMGFGFHFAGQAAVSKWEGERKAKAAQFQLREAQSSAERETALTLDVTELRKAVSEAQDGENAARQRADADRAAAEHLRAENAQALAEAEREAERLRNEGKIAQAELVQLRAALKEGRECTVIDWVPLPSPPSS